MTGNLLDVPDVARLSGKCRATIWRWANNGQIPAVAVVKFGRVSRFRREVLEHAGLIPAAPQQQEQVCDVG